MSFFCAKCDQQVNVVGENPVCIDSDDHDFLISRLLREDFPNIDNRNPPPGENQEQIPEVQQEAANVGAIDQADPPIINEEMDNENMILANVEVGNSDAEDSNYFIEIDPNFLPGNEYFNVDEGNSGDPETDSSDPESDDFKQKNSDGNKENSDNSEENLDDSEEQDLGNDSENSDDFNFDDWDDEFSLGNSVGTDDAATSSGKIEDVFKKTGNFKNSNKLSDSIKNFLLRNSFYCLMSKKNVETFT